MSITYELTKDDGVALMKYLWQRPERLRQERQQNDLLAVVIAVAIWLSLSRTTDILALLIALAAGLYLLKCLPQWRERKGKRWVNSDGFQQWLGSRTISTEENGLRVVSARGERLIYWGTLSEVIETDSHLFLPFGILEVVVVPARAFATTEARAAFVSELKSHQKPTPPSPAANEVEIS